MLTAAGGDIATTLGSARPAPVLRPRDEAEAAEMMSRPGHAAVAGGTDLCAAYIEGLSPVALVSLAGLPGLRGVTVTASDIRIGALTTHFEGARDAALRDALPGFADAWAMVANPRIRFRGTIGGNLLARRTRYEMALLLTAAGARLEFVGGLTAGADLVGVGPGALLRHVVIPRRPAQRFIYMRGLRPQITLAVMRHAGGGMAAIGTEWRAPVALPPEDTALDSLPEDFADPVISHWYAKRAGAALLRRGWEAIDA